MEEMEDFAENTHSSVLYILLNIYGAAGGVEGENISRAASHVGVCAGMVSRLRGMGHLAAQVIRMRGTDTVCLCVRVRVCV